MQDVHTKEIDLVNRDPKHLNDHVVKVRNDLQICLQMPIMYNANANYLIIMLSAADIYISIVPNEKVRSYITQVRRRLYCRL